MNIKLRLEQTEGITVIHDNLFRDVSDRRTKHTFKLNIDDDDFINYIEKVLDESDVDWEYFEDDESKFAIYEQL